MTSNWIEADWPAPANVKAVTTLRTGGVSIGSYTSLNPAMHVDDDPDCVKKNRQSIKEQLELPSEPVWLNQVHGNKVINADLSMQKVAADACIAGKPGIVCAVMTADCLPLLLCSRKGDKIAAVHGGWRSLLNGIIENTVLSMNEKNLMAWMGPAIGPEAFEVGEEVRNAFMRKSADFESAFTKRENSKYLADIYRITTVILNKQGIKEIYGGGFCTVTEQDRFYSYRRDGKTGRMASLIWRET